MKDFLPHQPPHKPPPKNLPRGSIDEEGHLPFVEAARSAASFMDGCGEAGEARLLRDGTELILSKLVKVGVFRETSNI